MRGASRDVALKVVVAIDQPVRGGRHVGGEAREARTCAEDEVVPDDVLDLDRILQKDGVTQILKANLPVRM